jgi:pSer/pThr/pTyr-binding forkhead associated (FHA) protein
MHVLNAAGTTIGLMPSARHTVIDVGEDVSREHARVWREDGRWLICDLQSTNGTRVIVRDTGEIVEVHDTPVELSVTDTVCLGSSTQFLVLPIMDPEM